MATIEQPREAEDLRTNHAAPPARTGRHANAPLVVLFLSVAGLAFALLQALVTPALPVIARDLHSSSSGVSWVLTAFLVSAAVATPIFGRLGDIAGKRRVLLVVLLVGAAGTLLAAVATSLWMLILARAVQGVSGATLPLCIGIARDELPQARVGIAVGLLSATVGIGGGLGCVLAGPIVGHLTWEWLFWVTLGVIGLALLGVSIGVPESPVRKPARLDLLGATLLSAALVSLLLAITKGREWGWTSWITIGLFIGGAAELAIFVLVEVRRRDPLINLRLMAHRAVWTTDLVGLTFGLAMFGLFLLVPTLLELPVATGYGFGASVTTAGLLLMPATSVMLVFGPLSGLLGHYFGSKLPLVLGSIALAAGYAVPAVDHSSTSMLLVSMLLIGIGVGMGFAAMANAIVEAVPIHHTAEATSINAVMRTIGGSIGMTVIAAVIASNSTPQGVPTDRAFTASFWICAGAGGLPILAALALPSMRRRHDEAGAAGVEDGDAPDDAIIAGTDVV